MNTTEKINRWLGEEDGGSVGTTTGDVAKVPGGTKKMYKKKDEDEEEEIDESSQIKTGDKFRISGGSGIDSGKIIRVVDKGKIKTDGRGIPVNTKSGAYKPVDWKKEVAIEFDNGELSTMFKNRLIRV